MAIFNSYVKLPEGKSNLKNVWIDIQKQRSILFWDVQKMVGRYRGVISGLVWGNWHANLWKSWGKNSQLPWCAADFSLNPPNYPSNMNHTPSCLCPPQPLDFQLRPRTVMRKNLTWTHHLPKRRGAGDQVLKYGYGLVWGQHLPPHSISTMVTMGYEDIN
jgi:hypothetical protein